MEIGRKLLFYFNLKSAPVIYHIDMRANLEDYYKLFNDRDAERVEAFDRIIASPYLGEELKAKIMQWYSTAKVSVPNLGDKGAKALVMSVVELATKSDDGLRQAIALGYMVNAAAPEEWRVRK